MIDWKRVAKEFRKSGLWNWRKANDLAERRDFWKRVAKVLWRRITIFGDLHERDYSELEEQFTADAARWSNERLELTNQLEAAEAKASRFEAALRWYAGYRNYDSNGAPFTLDEYGKEMDFGGTAREALGDE